VAGVTLHIDARRAARELPGGALGRRVETRVAHATDEGLARAGEKEQREQSGERNESRAWLHRALSLSS
jgi:hypothetical protein